jgi:hypothetical protein
MVRTVASTAPVVRLERYGRASRRFHRARSRHPVKIGFGDHVLRERAFG